LLRVAAEPRLHCPSLRIPLQRSGEGAPRRPHLEHLRAALWIAVELEHEARVGLGAEGEVELRRCTDPEAAVEEALRPRFVMGTQPLCKTAGFPVALLRSRERTTFPSRRPELTPQVAETRTACP
jgi:hypothetical protein